jgi:hypothetical protein
MEGTKEHSSNSGTYSNYIWSKRNNAGGSGLAVKVKSRESGPAHSGAKPSWLGWQSEVKPGFSPKSCGAAN